MTSDAESRLAIARGLQLAGRVDAAISAYEEVLALVPDYHLARREIGALSIERGDDARAIVELRRYVTSCPLDAGAHQRFIDALARQRGVDAALEHYGLVEHHPAPLAGGGVLGMLVVRDEVDRLGFTLDYHRSLGVDAFVVIDNDSTDGTGDLLHGRDDVHHWTTTASYRAGCAGYAWVAAVLGALDRAGWWMLLDADELFTYPPGDSLHLPDLCGVLDDEGAGALGAILVDCYPAGPVVAAPLAVGVDPRTVCEWFDREWQVGARQRAFPVDTGYLLTKTPLVKWHRGVVVEPGAHSIQGVPVSMRRAALLHFKLLGDVGERSRAEGERGDVIVPPHQHAYVDRFAAAPDLDLFDPAVSIAYQGPEQLVDLGIIV